MSRRPLNPESPSAASRESTGGLQGRDTLHDEVKKLRAVYERKSPDGHIFVLVNSLTEALKAKYDTGDTSLYNCLYSILQDAHDKLSDEPPDITPDHIPPMCRILYILLELDQPGLAPLFRRLQDHQLPFTREYLEQQLDRAALQECLGPGFRSFYDDFVRAQSAWCPLVFEVGGQWDHQVHYGTVIPYHAKRPILAEQAHSDYHARLYEVHIPKEFVDAKGLDSEIGPVLVEDENAEHRQASQGAPSDGLYYRFAVKEFSQSLKSSYDKEVRTFRALRNQSGMIQYYGCFESRADPERPTYNILLEYADYDLAGAVVAESPPISYDEITSFWQSLSEVATTLTEIHCLDINGHQYDFWHGDIKPENILRVGDHFKLADPGDSSIQRARHDQNLRPRAEVYGGTRTYAAPEKARWLDTESSSLDAALPDKICQNSDVWSLGCVFSVAATYVVLGDQGVKIYDRIRQHEHTKSSNGPTTDVFHDNKNVLDIVTDWHKYLRANTRRSDKFTSSVLDMVDDYMLTPAENRWEALQVSNHFQRLFSSVGKGKSEVPTTIEQMLQEIDLRAEIRQESDGGVNRLDSDVAKRHFRHEQESNGGTIRRARIRNESSVTQSAIKPTAQRSVHRQAILERFNQREPQRPPMPPIITSAGLHQISDETVPSTGSLYSTVTESHPEPLNVHKMGGKLKELGNGRSLFRNPHKSVKGKFSEDPLYPHYENRDLIFLVDNGSTMSQHWEEATYVLKILAWRALDYDSDGIELFFTDPTTTAKVPTGKNQKQEVNHFLKAMERAKPKDPGGKNHTETSITAQLSKIFPPGTPYLEGERKKTVLILTDGRWKGQKYPTEVDELLKFTILSIAGQDPKTLQSTSREPAGNPTWQEVFEEVRPITLQFIAFGHDNEGWARMKRLDDFMQQEGLPDVIDMEPSTGDTYKMLLGSISKSWDNQKNQANKEPPYIHSPSSSMSQMSNSGHETPRPDNRSSFITSSSASLIQQMSSPSEAGSPGFTFSAQVGGSRHTLSPFSDHDGFESVQRSPSRRSTRELTGPRSSRMSLNMNPFSRRRSTSRGQEDDEVRAADVQHGKASRR
ncbi:hypothetical protein QBC47DRAFT_83115 [Echria macrotheca]|uniref:Protein kinase domain-containing protein n=1 Tax=Echria macrotheca TaxID=438768 RepID=A0AAJ0F544_9PEZI|nr:hypothetical protein QBC47DRAFT_83115 [Echria macrotheca]